ncbi:hypothetical protein [Zobellia sp. 1_MG-2023]|uniref:hypothetical protein n=1 Tax=Zobellia sp. 1_MG-2023 TaxID=3062626 RepID=UPI0026E38E51|nr:hypothetical protein [Zobellia sp. 1_MG-2023]MDO6820211.1 hypothetical protein [Zobellia sp. 1_MG-2023]
MEIKFGKQLQINEISQVEISLFLLAVNHEKRKYTAYDNIIKTNSINKAIEFSYSNYLKIEKKSGIERMFISNLKDISKVLDKFFAKVKPSDNVNIVLDYSCMTKPWYYTFILYLKKKKLKLDSVVVFFVYTPSSHEKPQSPKSNSEIAPLPGKYVVPTDKPKALIVCLGYEKKKAEGIIEHLDPKRCFLFYSKPALDNDFVKHIESSNANILKESNDIITYDFKNLTQLERELTSLYYLLRDDYSIIIAPLGPKPFTFMSMLLSVKYHDIDIWRVGSGSDINEYERKPIDNQTFIISKVVFERSAKNQLHSW